LLVVASGSLAQLPLQVLITRRSGVDPASPSAFRKVEWLARSNAVSVLPAVSSQQALRRQIRSGIAQKRYLGFGNPLLDGPDSAHTTRAQQALAKQTCGNARPANHPVLVWGTTAPVQRSGVVDVAELRTQAPLPETADELCTVHVI
jgi:hypothetical protein